MYYIQCFMEMRLHSSSVHLLTCCCPRQGISHQHTDTQTQTNTHTWKERDRAGCCSVSCTRSRLLQLVPSIDLHILHPEQWRGKKAPFLHQPCAWAQVQLYSDTQNLNSVVSWYCLLRRTIFPRVTQSLELLIEINARLLLSLWLVLTHKLRRTLKYAPLVKHKHWVLSGPSMLMTWLE